MDDSRLHTAWQQRQFYDSVSHLSQPLSFLKRTLAKRVKQLSRLAEIWDELIPEAISDHTALESFSRGVLTVKVDSSPHRFQLRTLLNGGLFGEMQVRFPGALNKVRLEPGQFFAVDIGGARRYEF